jgi:transposase-like protein
MEEVSSANRRQFRSRSAILDLLEAYGQSGLSIKAFCAERSIPQGSFHNWRKRYEKDNRSGSDSFTSLQLSVAAAGLFAEVNGIKLYQPVSPAYLKELAS